MHHISSVRRRFRALAPAAVLLLALCLLAGGAQAAYTPGVQRYVAGDVLEITAANTTSQIVIAKVDTTSLPTPYYTAFDVVQNAGRWEIPRYWNFVTKVDEQNLVENLQARRIGHVDPVLAVVTDSTITGGFMLYYGLSLAEAQAGTIYPVEPAPGESVGVPNYIVGDILGNVSDPTRGAVVKTVRLNAGDGQYWYRAYLDTVQSGDRWMIEKYYNGDMEFPMAVLGQNDMRRAAHADPHIVIVNDTTTSTGDIGWYRLSLAEVIAGKSYNHMAPPRYVTGDILGNDTAPTRYIVANATSFEEGVPDYILYAAERDGDGWSIPAYVQSGLRLDGQQVTDLNLDLRDHTDPHFAIVADRAVDGGVTYFGLSLGEILEGTPGYPPETPPPVGGDKGYFLVSTAPAGAAIYLEDISGTRYLEGNTTNGPLNVTIMLTATPVRKIVANLSGYRDASFNITQYPAKDQTVPVDLALALLPTVTPSPPYWIPYKPHAIPGRIEAEDYDIRGFSDTTPGNTGGAYRQDDVDIEPLPGGLGFNVGWIRNGEYLVYTVNVPQNGTYKVSARVASPNSARFVELSVDGQQQIAIEVPNTRSFDSYTTVTPRFAGDVPVNTVTQTPTPGSTGGDVLHMPIALTAGTHVIKLAFVRDGQNLDWIEFAPVTTPTPTPNGSTPYKALAIPGTIQAEDYNLGGEGVAYHDTTPGNEGGVYRHDDVDIEQTAGLATPNVGWIRSGEYLTYTATVQADPYRSTGTYTMTARVASPSNGRTAALSVDGAPMTTIVVPNTGSYTSFATVSFLVTLPAGIHTLKLTFQGDGQNLDWIAFGAPPTPTVTSTPTPGAGGASFTAAPLTASHGSAVKFTVTPAAGKSISAAWWSFDAPAHLNTWNSRAINPTFFYPAAGTFSPLVKITYTDGSSETVQRANYIRAT